MKSIRKIAFGLMILVAAMITNFSIAMAEDLITICPWTQWIGDAQGDPHSPNMGHLDCICVSEEVSNGARIISVKSSNTKVLRVKKMGSQLFRGVRLIPVKKGKSKVTLTYKYNGRKYKTSAVYAVKDPDVFNCIKVNGKKINLKENNGGYWFSNYKKKKLTVKFSGKKGWKMDRLGSEVVFEDGNPAIKFKNGMTIKMPKDKMFINLSMRRGKNDWYFLSLGFTPNDQF